MILLPLLADAQLSTSHQFVRLQSMTEWWHWLALLAVCVGIVAYVVRVYQRDSEELTRGLAAMLLVLRLSA